MKKEADAMLMTDSLHSDVLVTSNVSGKKRRRQFGVKKTRIGVFGTSNDSVRIEMSYMRERLCALFEHCYFGLS